MKQNELHPAPGSRKEKRRVGRGAGSGRGIYCGRGVKGQKARSGAMKVSPSFEGGQLPLIKRLPRKRGFTNIFKTEYSIINVGMLNMFAPDSEVTPEKLLAAGLIKSQRYPIKILAEGDIKQPLLVKAHRFSNTAKAKIEAAGGKVEEIEHAPQAN